MQHSASCKYRQMWLSNTYNICLPNVSRSGSIRWQSLEIQVKYKHMLKCTLGNWLRSINRKCLWISLKAATQAVITAL